MLKRIVLSACAVCLLAASAEAGTIASVIQNSVLSRLSDNSFDILQNKDPANPGSFLAPGTGDTVVHEGDRLIAIARVDQVSSPFGAPDKIFGVDWDDEFTLVAVIEVVDKAPGAFDFRFSFGAPATDPLGLGWSPGTMVAFYSDPANDYDGSPTSFLDGINDASGGTPWWEFGMTAAATDPYSGPGAASANANGEYWTATSETDDISVLASVDPGVSGGTFQIGLNLIAQNGGLQLIPVNVAGLEVTGGGNLLGNGPTLGVPGGYQAFDDLNFTVQAVPEPASMAIWGCAIAGGVVARRRHRRKK